VAAQVADAAAHPQRDVHGVRRFVERARAVRDGAAMLGGLAPGAFAATAPRGARRRQGELQLRHLDSGNLTKAVLKMNMNVKHDALIRGADGQGRAVDYP
jgi:hypothetical protein